MAPLSAHTQTAAVPGPFGIAQTGQAVPAMESYDRIIARIMRDFDIPGAAVAVLRHGRLVYARGFGMADREAGTAVQPDALFRIASVSKPITAVAVLKLVEDGLLDLDARVFPDLLADVGPGRVADARMNRITVRDLLRHSGGFDRDISGDPQFLQWDISRELRKPTPLDCVDIIAYMKSRRLDFAPGDRFAYSNFGYCVLGRVVERASGLTYEAYVRTRVLLPAGAIHPRVADPFVAGRLPNEVTYYDYPGAGLSESLDRKVTGRVPWPYNGSLSTMDAHGGWAASAIDLLRFVNAVDGRYRDGLIDHTTVELMISRPPYEPGPVWNGFGWLVRDLGNGESNWWHTGFFAGTFSLVVRAANGHAWAVLMNTRLPG